MEKEEIRKIIQEELSNILKIDRFVFDKLIQILDARNIQVGRSNGLKFGTETTQKIGFWNKTPVIQPTVISDPDDAGALYSQAQVQTIVDKVKAIIDLLQSVGFMGT